MELNAGGLGLPREQISGERSQDGVNKHHIVGQGPVHRRHPSKEGYVPKTPRHQNHAREGHSPPRSSQI